MRFSEILKKALEEYKDNFDAIFKLTAILVLVPSILILIPTPLPGSDRGFLITDLILVIPLTLIAFFANLYFIATLTKTSLDKSKYKLKEFFSLNSKLYLYFVGYIFVSGIFTAGLFLLLIIPGVIFFTYWILGSYVFFKEKKGILKSLKTSRYLIKGRWWKVFGYTLLMFIILLPVCLIMVPSYIVDFYIASMPNAPLTVYIIGSILAIICKFTYTLITYPITALFYKYLYFELRNEKK